MVVSHFDVMDVALFEFKTNPPSRVYRNRPLTGAITLKRVKIDALQGWDIRKGFRGVQDIETFDRKLQIQSAKLAPVAINVQAPGGFVTKALDQRLNVLRAP